MAAFVPGRSCRVGIGPRLAVRGAQEHAWGYGMLRRVWFHELPITTFGRGRGAVQKLTSRIK